MDIKITTKPTSTEAAKIQEQNEKSLPQQTVDGDNFGEINHIAVKQVLDIGRDDNSYDSDINILVNWAKSQTDSDDPMELKWIVRDLQMRLGTPLHGDSIKQLSRFAYLDLEEKRIKKEKSTFI